MILKFKFKTESVHLQHVQLFLSTKQNANQGLRLESQI